MLSKHFLGDLIISNLIFGSYWPSFLSCPGLNVSHVFWVFWSLPANVSGFIPGTNTSRPPWYSQLCPPSKGGSSLSPTQPGPISLQWFGLGRGTWFPSLSLSPLLFLLHRVACKEKVKERRSRKSLSDGSSMTWHLHFHTCLLFSHSVVSDYWVKPDLSFSVHGISQRSILMWAAVSFSRASCALGRSLNLNQPALSDKTELWVSHECPPTSDPPQKHTFSALKNSLHASHPRSRDFPWLRHQSFSLISYISYIFHIGHTVLGVLKARILKWFAIPFSSGPRFVRTLHHDLSVLGGRTQHGS